VHRRSPSEKGVSRFNFQLFKKKNQGGTGGREKGGEKKTRKGKGVLTDALAILKKDPKIRLRPSKKKLEKSSQLGGCEQMAGKLRGVQKKKKGQKTSHLIQYFSAGCGKGEIDSEGLRELRIQVEKGRGLGP